jgi:hypothetical protein
MPRPKKNITNVPPVVCSITNVVDVVDDEVLIAEKINNSIEVPQKSKRGRKSKKELELLNNTNLISNSILGENIILSQIPVDCFQEDITIKYYGTNDMQLVVEFNQDMVTNFYLFQPLKKVDPNSFAFLQLIN